jgi:hypothetical protein
MRRRYARLLGLGVAALLTPVIATFGAVASAAGPTGITLAGPGLAETLTVPAADAPDLFRKLLREVDWLAARPANAPPPETAQLGPKYQLVVLVDNAPNQAYDLYPLAVGGPRVFRPAEQPSKKRVAAAWLYGRVGMPDTLRDAGVPLIPPSGNQPGSAGGGQTGGQGGGAGQVDVGGVGNPPSGSGFDGVFEEWQRGILLIGGGAVVLLLLLGGVSLLVRKGP